MGILQSPPSVCPSRYLLLNIGRNPTKFGVPVSPMNGVCNCTFFGPAPLGPWGGTKRSNIIKFQLQSQFQRLLYQIYVFSQIKDIKHQIIGFLFSRLGHAQRWDLGEPGGSYLYVCPSCYLFLNHWTKSNQIWFSSYSHERACNGTFFCSFPCGPGEGPKGKILFSF